MRSIPSMAGLTMYDSVGRADRVAAARILKERAKEIDKEIKENNGEERLINQRKDRMGAPPATGTPERERYDVEMKGYDSRLDEIADDRETALKEKAKIEENLEEYKRLVGVSNSAVRRRLY